MDVDVDVGGGGGCGEDVAHGRGQDEEEVVEEGGYSDQALMLVLSLQLQL